MTGSHRDGSHPRSWKFDKTEAVGVASVLRARGPRPRWMRACRQAGRAWQAGRQFIQSAMEKAGWVRQKRVLLPEGSRLVVVQSERGRPERQHRPPNAGTYPVYGRREAVRRD